MSAGLEYSRWVAFDSAGAVVVTAYRRGSFRRKLTRAWFAESWESSPTPRGMKPGALRDVVYGPMPLTPAWFQGASATP